jgi:hypothetical protein
VKSVFDTSPGSLSAFQVSACQHFSFQLLNLDFTGQRFSFNFEFQNVSISAFQRLNWCFLLSEFQLLILRFPWPVKSVVVTSPGSISAFD